MSSRCDVGASLPGIAHGKCRKEWEDPNYWSNQTKRTRWEEYVAPMGNRNCAYRVLVGKPEGKGQLEDVGVDGRIILK